MEVGAWVNVIGYVEDVAKSAGRKAKGEQRGDGGVEGKTELLAKVKVKAVLLWGASGVKLGEYEKTLEERLKSGRGDAR